MRNKTNRDLFARLNFLVPQLCCTTSQLPRNPARHLRLDNKKRRGCIGPPRDLEPPLCDTI